MKESPGRLSRTALGGALLLLLCLHGVNAGAASDDLAVTAGAALENGLANGFPSPVALTVVDERGFVARLLPKKKIPVRKPKPGGRRRLLIAERPTGKGSLTNNVQDPLGPL